MGLQVRGTAFSCIAVGGVEFIWPCGSVAAKTGIERAGNERGRAEDGRGLAGGC